MLWRKPKRCGGVIRWTSLLRQQFYAWLQDGCGHEYVRGKAMVRSLNARAIANLGFASALTIFLGACGGMSLPSFSSIFGASIHSPAWRRKCRPPSAPTRSSAAGACLVPESRRPRAHRGRGKGAMQAALRDRRRHFRRRGHASGRPGDTAGTAPQGRPSGKNYIGPAGPAAGEQDREIVSFDGRVLVTRFTDKDAATRYGNMVYVRCGPRA